MTFWCRTCSCFPLIGYEISTHFFNEYCIGKIFDLQDIRKQWPNLGVVTLPRLMGTADRVPAGLAAGWGSNTDFTSSRIGSGAWEKKLDFRLFISCTELVLRWKTQSSIFGITRVQCLWLYHRKACFCMKQCRIKRCSFSLHTWNCLKCQSSWY